MNDVILILRDIMLEAQTASRHLEHDDRVTGGMQYIEDMAKRAIEKLGGEV